MKKWWLLLFLALILIDLNADQIVLSPNIPLVEKEFGIDDAQIGYTASSFIVIGTVMSLLFGYLSDKYQRRKLMLWSILLGEIPCLLSAFSQNYGQFFLFRTLTGIGIGAMYPIVFSYISDVYDEFSRARVVTYLATAIGFGGVVGMAVSGFVSPVYGWRLPFILFSVPNIILILLFYFISEEPRRGASEYAVDELVKAGVPYPGKVRLSDYKKLFTVPTNLFLFLQGMVGAIPWGAIPFFYVTFLNRYRGLSIQSATVIFLIFGLGNFVGTLVGGMIGGKLYRLKPVYMPIFSAIAAGTGALLFLWLLAIPNVDTASGYLLLIVVGFTAVAVASMISANAKTMLMNVNDVETRGRIFSIFNLTDSLGMGLGKLIGGSLSIALGSMAVALNVSAMFWFACAFFLFLVAYNLTRDMKKLHFKLGVIAKEMKG